MNGKLAAAIIVIMAAAKENRKDSYWVWRWVARRPKFGAYASLFTELAIEDPSQYKIYLRTQVEALRRRHPAWTCASDVALLKGRPSRGVATG